MGEDSRRRSRSRSHKRRQKRSTSRSYERRSRTRSYERRRRRSRSRSRSHGRRRERKQERPKLKLPPGAKNVSMSEEVHQGSIVKKHDHWGWILASRNAREHGCRSWVYFHEKACKEFDSLRPKDNVEYYLIQYEDKRGQDQINATEVKR